MRDSRDQIVRDDFASGTNVEQDFRGGGFYGGNGAKAR